MDILTSGVSPTDVGQRLRKLRKDRNMSMRTLAQRSGLSANALSTIERNKASPTVSTLYKLADAMGVHITAFFEEEKPRQAIVFTKAAERSRTAIEHGLLEGLGSEQFAGKIDAFILTIESKATSGPSNIVHAGQEFVLCLKGQIEYQVDNHSFLLKQGDSLLFAAYLQHRWYNPGPTEANILVIITCFEEEFTGRFHMTTPVKGKKE